MDFNISVRDDNRDIKILAPWFLNCLNKVSNSNTSKFELKHGRIDNISSSIRRRTHFLSLFFSSSSFLYFS